MADMLDKLRKLLAQQRGEEALGNVGAAALFAEKIAELLIKHKLEFSEVDRAEEEETDPLCYQRIYPEQWGDERLPKRVAWTEGLADIIAKHFFCRGLALLESNCIMLVGRSSDIDIATEVFCKIMRTGLNLCEAAIAEEILNFKDALDAKLWEFRGGNEDYRYSFFAGFNNTILQRLDTNRRHIEQATSDSTALVRCEKEVDDYVKEFIKPENVPPEEKFRRMQRDAFRRGVEYGRRVDLSPDAAPTNHNRAKESLNGQ